MTFKIGNNRNQTRFPLIAIITIITRTTLAFHHSPLSSCFLNRQQQHQHQQQHYPLSSSSLSSSNVEDSSILSNDLTNMNDNEIEEQEKDENDDSSSTIPQTSPTEETSTTFKSESVIDIQNLEGVIMPENGLGNPCVIKVLGVGGGGGNAVNRMIQTQIEGVSFWGINTDAQALAKSLAPNKLNIGREITRGLGAGGEPSVGKASAEENIEEITQICQGADLIFVTAGMGGGTGSGAAPVVAGIAKNTCHALTVGVVTKPFGFEGRHRMKQADKAIEELKKHVDTLIVVSNDKLLKIIPEKTTMDDAFLVADDVLRQGVVGISEIIIKVGQINVDFADVQSVMKNAGTALMGMGTGVGKYRTRDAALAAISSPLLDFPIRKAKGVLLNIVGGPDLGLSEAVAASEVIYENADKDANIIFGVNIDDNMGEEVSITVLACGFDDDDDDDDNNEAVPLTSNERDDESRDANFYKERRKLTRSPLGDSASLEETRTFLRLGAIAPDEKKEAKENKKPPKKSFFRRLISKVSRISKI